MTEVSAGIGSVGSVNLADVSQFLVGSDTLKVTPFFIKNFTIPGIAFSHASLLTRSGIALGTGADVMDFNDLNMDVVLDSNYSTYFELLDLVFKEVDFHQDTFATPEFDLWVQVLNSQGELLFRVDFRNCRISSIGELALDTSAELGASVSIGVTYDYWEYTRSVCIKEPQSPPSPTNPEGLEVVVDSSGCKTGPKRWFEKPLNSVRR